MREHKGYLYVGGILNNRIGRYSIPGADPNWTGPRSYWGARHDRCSDALLDHLPRRRRVTIPPMDGALRPNTAARRGAIACCRCDGAGQSRAGDGGASAVLQRQRASVAGPRRRRGRSGRATSTRRSPRWPRSATGRPGDRPRRRRASCSRADGMTAASIAGRPAARLPDGARLRRSRHAARRQRLGRPSPLATGVVDLMQQGRERLGLAHRSRRRRRDAASPSDLAFPYGVLVAPSGGGWSSRRAGGTGWSRIAAAAAAAPSRCSPTCRAIPARLAPAADGGAWLALFAPRNRLDRVRAARGRLPRRMMREVDRALLDRAGAAVRRAASSSRCRAAASRRMGIHKPWSPTPLLRPGRRARRGSCSRSPASTAAPTARATASPAPSSTTAALLAASKGGDAILALDRRPEAGATA